jgi:hypothetical protein
MFLSGLFLILFRVLIVKIKYQSIGFKSDSNSFFFVLYRVSCSIYIKKRGLNYILAFVLENNLFLQINIFK